MLLLLLFCSLEALWSVRVGKDCRWFACNVHATHDYELHEVGGGLVAAAHCILRLCLADIKQWVLVHYSTRYPHFLPGLSLGEV